MAMGASLRKDEFHGFELLSQIASNSQCMYRYRGALKDFNDSISGMKETILLLSEVLPLECFSLDLSMNLSNPMQKHPLGSASYLSACNSCFSAQGFVFAVDIVDEKSVLHGGHFEHLMHKLRPPSIPTKPSLQAVGLRLSFEKLLRVTKLLRDPCRSLGFSSTSIIECFVYSPRSQNSKLIILLELLRNSGIRATPFANALFVERMNNSCDANSLKSLCQSARVSFFIKIADKPKFEVIAVSTQNPLT